MDIEEEDEPGGYWTYLFQNKSNSKLQIFLDYYTDGYVMIQYSNHAIR